MRMLATFAAAAHLALAALAAAQAPDLVLLHANVATMDPARPAAQALAVRGGTILAVGADAEISRLAGPATRVIDAKGGFVCPGFADAHAHFAGLGASLRIVDLTGTTSFAEVVARARAAAQAQPEGAWIVGRGWDQNLWATREFPEHAPLSAALPKHPVHLVRVDGHASIANAAAMRLAKIGDATANPPGGELLRDAQGRLTGVLVDNAMSLVTVVMPAVDASSVRQDLAAAQARCFENGITCIHDAGTDRATIALMGEMLESGALRIRVHAMLGGSGSRAAADHLKAPPIAGAHGGRLNVRTLKLGIDGALGSRGAALLADYADRPGHRGLLMISPKELEAIGDAALTGGYQVCVHAIGDLGNRAVIEAWEALAKRRPEFRAARFRLEHAQILDPADVARIKALGIIVSMQGVHCTSDMPWVPERIGPERTRAGAYVWRTLIDAGIPFCNGTDAPVESISVLDGLYSLTTRMRQDGTPPGGWNPAQRLTPAEALAACTTGPAYASFQESTLGRLAPGYAADFVILDTDLLRCTAPDLLRAKVMTTVLAGDVVYSR
jgi:predicted amidohydrolase YtcJ